MPDSDGDDDGGVGGGAALMAPCHGAHGAGGAVPRRRCRTRSSCDRLSRTASAPNPPTPTPTPTPRGGGDDVVVVVEVLLQPPNIIMHSAHGMFVYVRQMTV